MLPLITFLLPPSRLSLLITIFVFINTEFICQHDPSANVLKTGYTTSSDHTSTTSHPNFNVVFHYDHATPAIAEVLVRIQEHLGTRVRITGTPWLRVTLSRDCPSTATGSGVQTFCVDRCQEETFCGPVKVPRDHLGRCYVCVDQGTRCGFTVDSEAGGGVEGHLLIYVTERKEGCGNSYPGIHGNTCQVAPATLSPIAGYLSVCPDLVDRYGTDELFNVLLHQMFHVMGVSGDVYKRAALEQSRKIQTIPYDAGTLSEPRPTTITTLNGDKAQQLMAAHFGCNGNATKDDGSSTMGLILEDQDPGLSHLEGRLFRREGMALRVTPESVFSAASWIMLEETGWYIITPSPTLSPPSPTPGPPYPRVPDCTITTISCRIWSEARRSEGKNTFPFCDTYTTDYTCDSTSHRHVVRCQRVKYEEGVVPGKYAYPVPDIAGPHKYEDYCMVHDVTSRDTATCSNEQHSPSENFFLETYGRGSRCIRHHDRWNVNGGMKEKGAGCYHICCRTSSFDVTMNNGDNTYSCYEENQQVHVSSGDNHVRGMITCPAYGDVCGGGDDIPTCHLPGRCITPEITNGQVYASDSGYQIRSGATVTIICFHGYRLRGAATLVCMGDNTFSRPSPVCLKSCTRPDITNGSIRSDYPEILQGDRVTVTCNPDYALNASTSHLTCTGGAWSRDIPTCTKEYTTWSPWSECTGVCGVGKQEYQVRTRRCTSCPDIQWEKRLCTGTCTKQIKPIEKPGVTLTPNTTTPSQTILIAIFGSLLSVVIIVIMIILLLWYNNQKKHLQRRREGFDESYYVVKMNQGNWNTDPRTNVLLPPKSRSLDLGTERGLARSQIADLFTSPPATPQKQKSLDSIDSTDSILKVIPRVKYKRRARIFPKLEQTLPAHPPPPYTVNATGLALLADIRAAQMRVRNDPQIRKLLSRDPGARGLPYSPNKIPFQIREEEEGTEVVEETVEVMEEAVDVVEEVVETGLEGSYEIDSEVKASKSK